MIAGSRETGSFDFEAVLRGALWGFLFMVAVALIIAFWGPSFPALEQYYYLHDDPIRWVVSGIAALIAGFVAGRRAGTLGLVHGAVAALGSFLILALVSGILSGTPNVWDFGLRVVVSVIVGGLGGILGANMAD